MKVRAAARKLTEYDYEFAPPDWSVADAEETREWYAFVPWMSLARKTGFEHRAWNTALAEVVATATAAADRQAEKRAAEQWTSWFNEGPAKGLRRQHRLSRAATG